MRAWLKAKAIALAHLVVSQRTITAAGAFLLVNKLGVPPELGAKLAAGLATILIGSFAYRPPGAPSPTTVFVRSVSPGGAPQAVDPENPRR